MKRYLQIVTSMVLTLLTLTACGGGGGSSSSGNTPTPTAATLALSTPSVDVVDSANLTALATDAKGNPVSGVPVTFTVVSGNGSLSSTSGTTDQAGVVETTLTSTKTGFINVKATASGLTKEVIVYFTQAQTTTDTLKMYIDADSDGNFNQPTDFYLPADGKTTATVEAQILDVTGQPVSGKTVAFSSDYAGVTFAGGKNTAITDDRGLAVVAVSVDPTVKAATDIVLILASEPVDTGVGVHNMLSFYLEPLQVQSLQFSWRPAGIKPGESAAITVLPFLSDGKNPPDGTVINMSCTLGSCPPVGLLQSGQYVTTFTSDGTSGNALITTTVGGVTKVFPIAVSN